MHRLLNVSRFPLYREHTYSPRLLTDRLRLPIREIVEHKMKTSKWKLVDCESCRGLGIVAHYSAHDFEGETDCFTCKGIGHLSVTPKGRLILYPGGPFAGRMANVERMERSLK